VKIGHRDASCHLALLPFLQILNHVRVIRIEKPIASKTRFNRRLFRATKARCGASTSGLLKFQRISLHFSSIELLGPCFVAPKVLREEAASAEIVPRKWPKVPFYRASALQTDIKIE
jgi:hypothetical protein